MMTLLIAVASVFLVMLGMFLWSLISRNNGYADVVWGLCIILVALVTFIGGETETMKRAVVTLFVVIWGVRLSTRVFLRNVNKEESFRYRTWRESWGKMFFLRSFFQIYVLQGILLIFVSIPVILVNLYGGGSLGILDFLGISLWLTGFYFEARGDLELDRFKQKPENKEKIMKDGLWSLTRHPNYFGEAVQWFGISIIALSVPYGFVGLISPLLIAFLLIRVSGIPMLEERLRQNPEFEEYRKSTPAFLPNFSKKFLR